MTAYPRYVIIMTFYVNKTQLRFTKAYFSYVVETSFHTIELRKVQLVFVVVYMCGQNFINIFILVQ